MLYELTIDDGCGFARYITRKREDAALLWLEKLIYEACEAQGLRDRPIAHLARAHSWTKHHPIEPIRIGTYTITISIKGV